MLQILIPVENILEKIADTQPEVDARFYLVIVFSCGCVGIKFVRRAGIQILVENIRGIQC